MSIKFCFNFRSSSRKSVSPSDEIPSVDSGLNTIKPFTTVVYSGSDISYPSQGSLMMEKAWYIWPSH
jgi:hypothetical protein